METTSATVTAALVQPIVDTIQSNVDVLLPVGIGIMAVMIGLSLIPRVVYKFL